MKLFQEKMCTSCCLSRRPSQRSVACGIVYGGAAGSGVSLQPAGEVTAFAV